LARWYATPGTFYPMHFLVHECCGPRRDTAEEAVTEWNAANAAPAHRRALDRELRIRNLIAEREFNTATANREIAAFGEWRCDHAALDREIEAAIAALLAPDAGEVAP